MAESFFQAARSGLSSRLAGESTNERLPVHWLKPVRSFVIYFLLAHVIFGLILMADVASLLARFFTLSDSAAEQIVRSEETGQQLFEQLNENNHGWSVLLISYSEMLGIFSIIAAIVVALTVSASAKIKDLDRELRGLDRDAEIERIVEDRSVDIDMLYGGLLTATMVSLVLTVLYGHGVITAADGSCSPAQGTCTFTGDYPWDVFARHWMLLISPKMLFFLFMAFFFLILALSASDSGRLRGQILRRIDLSRQLAKNERTLAMFGALHDGPDGTPGVLPRVPWGIRLASALCYVLVSWLSLYLIIVLFGTVQRLVGGDAFKEVVQSWFEPQLLVGISLLAIVSIISVLAVILAMGLTRLHLVNDVYYIIVTVIIAAVPVTFLVAVVSRYPVDLIGLILLYLAVLLVVTNLLWGYAIYSVRKAVDNAEAAAYVEKNDAVDGNGDSEVDREVTSARPRQGFTHGFAVFFSAFLRGTLVHRVRRVQFNYAEVTAELEQSEEN